MNEILEVLDGFVFEMDDILVYRSDQTEQNKRLHTVLAKLQDSGITLNKGSVNYQSQKSSLLVISLTKIESFLIQKRCQL